MGESASGDDQVKASVLRGYAEALREMKLFDAVRSAVPASTGELLSAPPPSTVWLPGVVIEHIANAVADAQGLAGVRACGSRASELGTGRIARALTEGVLRVFSPSPTSIFSRYATMSSTFCRGVDFTWAGEGDEAGTMEMRISSRPVSMPSFVATAGGFEYVLRICGAKGEVTDPVPIATTSGGAARYRIRWKR